MKYCPTCGKELERKPGLDTKQKNADEIIRMYQCPDGHIFKAILDSYGGPSILQEVF
jgi:hypothetical protein